jgi:DNA-binding NarL/FixJ family response regulator
VLLCEGPRLLSWVGATRAEPFTPREVSLLRFFVGPLHRRLVLEEQVGACWPARALEVALEAVPRAALLLGPTNTIEIANRHARAMVERSVRAVVESIRQSQRQASEGGFEVTPLTMAGHPPYVLAIAKVPEPSLGNLIVIAQTQWGLTARQVCVLELMGSGASNREIAQRLACAEVTVENHITGLYRRSGARSRAELFVRLFALAQR